MCVCETVNVEILKKNTLWWISCLFLCVFSSFHMGVKIKAHWRNNALTHERVCTQIPLSVYQDVSEWLCLLVQFDVKRCDHKGWQLQLRPGERVSLQDQLTTKPCMQLTCFFKYFSCTNTHPTWNTRYIYIYKQYRTTYRRAIQTTC